MSGLVKQVPAVSSAPTWLCGGSPITLGGRSKQLPQTHRGLAVYREVTSDAIKKEALRHDLQGECGDPRALLAYLEVKGTGLNGKRGSRVCERPGNVRPHAHG